MASLDSLDPSLPPFIPIPGVANLRDMGGYATATSSPSRVVRPGILYRAADPCSCSDASIRRLRDELGIATIFDLRAKPEIDRNANAEGDVPAFEQRLTQVSNDGGSSGSSSSDGRGTIKREWTPVFKEEDYSPEGVAMRFRDYASEGTEGFVRAYSAIAAHGAECYARIFRQLASIAPAGAEESTSTRRNEGVLIHCTAGKDRTGVFAALVLSLLGVDDETVAREYTLTEVGLWEKKPVFIERLLASPAFQDPNGPGREGVERMVTCTDEKMLDTLKMFRERYGGAEGYVSDVLGLSDQEIKRIRDVLTVDVGRPQPAL